MLKAKRVKEEALLIERVKRQALSVQDRAHNKLEQGLPFVVGVRAEQGKRRTESKREVDQQNYTMFIRNTNN